MTAFRKAVCHTQKLNILSYEPREQHRFPVLLIEMEVLPLDLKALLLIESGGL